MRIANKVAFGTISYLLTGDTHLNIKFQRMGYWKEEIFDGKFSELRKNRSLYDRLGNMPVTAIYAEGDVMTLGVEEDYKR